MPKDTTTLLRVRVDESLKEEADKVFEDMGLSTASAVRLFLRQTIIGRKLPFQPVAQDEGFYGEANQERFRSAIQQLNKPHELIES